MSEEALWLKAFLKTELIELLSGLIILFWISARDSSITRPMITRDSFIILTATGVTHPPLWFIIPGICHRWGLGELGYVMIGESIVVAIEALFYWQTLAPLGKMWSRSLSFSLTLNTLSYGLGFVI